MTPRRAITLPPDRPYQRVQAGIYKRAKAELALTDSVADRRRLMSAVNDVFDEAVKDREEELVQFGIDRLASP